MKRRDEHARTAAWALLALFSTAGCGGGGAAPPEPRAGASGAAAAAHAPADVEPGSYADWCGEHAVPESQCTRCNPALIAAFQATGDWCAEHSLPESQCKTCNPDLKIERPPRPVAD